MKTFLHILSAFALFTTACVSGDGLVQGWQEKATLELYLRSGVKSCQLG